MKKLTESKLLELLKAAHAKGWHDHKKFNDFLNDLRSINPNPKPVDLQKIKDFLGVLEKDANTILKDLIDSQKDCK